MPTAWRGFGIENPDATAKDFLSSPASLLRLLALIPSLELSRLQVKHLAVVGFLQFLEFLDLVREQLIEG